MKNFIPLIILTCFIILISIAINNLSNKQSDNATNSAKNLNDNSEEVDDNKIVDFEQIEIDLPEFEVADLFEKDKKITKKDFIGKYTIINFFASWCTTCRMEHDLLLRIQQEGIADLVGMAWKDIDKNTVKLLKESGNPFSKVGVDGKGVFRDSLEIEAVPETWLINPQGKVVLRLKGNMQDFSIEDIRRYIKAH